MRCPKCGFNSFDHLENCKKCGKDLTEHKSRFEIKSILLSGIATAEEEEIEEIETEEPVAAMPVPAPEETEPETTTEEPASESDSGDFGFNFMGDSEEEENLAFDELFEESSLEDDVEETLPSPEAPAAEDPEETPRENDLNNPSSFDLADPEPLGTDFDLDDSASSDLGLDEPENLKDFQDDSSSTELGLDETDFDDFNGDDELGTTEDPNRPFDRQECFPSESTPVDFSETNPEGPQEELFSGNDELPPLPDTVIEEQPLESLETSFGGRPLDSTETSDAFALGALPSAELSAQQELAEQAKPETYGPAESPDELLAEPETAAESNATPPPFARRIGAFLCDMILLGVVGFCFIIVAETALSENPDGFFPSMNTLIDLSIPYFLVVFCLTFGYFTLFHFLAGQTPGKMLTSMRVETTSSEAISFSQAFMRSAGGLIQTLPAGLGYLTALSKDGRGWNDRLAGTRLVDLKNLVEKENDEGTAELLDMENPAEQENF